MLEKGKFLNIEHDKTNIRKRKNRGNTLMKTLYGILSLSDRPFSVVRRFVSEWRSAPSVCLDGIWKGSEQRLVPPDTMMSTAL